MTTRRKRGDTKTAQPTEYSAELSLQEVFDRWSAAHLTKKKGATCSGPDVFAHFEMYAYAHRVERHQFAQLMYSAGHRHELMIGVKLNLLPFWQGVDFNRGEVRRRQRPTANTEAQDASGEWVSIREGGA